MNSKTTTFGGYFCVKVQKIIVAFIRSWETEYCYYFGHDQNDHIDRMIALNGDRKVA